MSAIGGKEEEEEGQEGSDATIGEEGEGEVVLPPGMSSGLEGGGRGPVVSEDRVVALRELMGRSLTPLAIVEQKVWQEGIVTRCIACA